MRGKLDCDELSWGAAFCKTLPLRMLSRLWGDVHHIKLGESMRIPMFKFWTWAFGCNLDEMRDPLESYENLNAFFTRHLKPGARPISSDPLVSPTDGVLTVLGKMEPGERIDQVKGLSYSLKRLLGAQPKIDPKSNVYYAVIYLAPGDYHRIHCATDFKLSTRRHVAGELFSVSPHFVKLVPSLFTLNERLVLEGSWKHGFFSMVPVGAYNVGSIVFELEPELRTNRFLSKSAEYYRPISKAIDMDVAKGAEVARFELGSTVVLVFETKDAEFDFGIKAGEKVKVGQSLGKVVPLGTTQGGLHSPATAPKA
jgi:phosphatidylserine decarboxylase